MDVLVLHIKWVRDIPIAKVYDVVDGTIFRVSLLHRSYMCRYRIGVGTVLRVSSNRFITHVLSVTEHTHYAPSNDAAFDRWFVFRNQVQPYLPLGTARKLFRSGIETIQELQRRVHDVSLIRGIGPVASIRIQQMLLVLFLPPT